MVGILGDPKIRVGILYLSVFLYCSYPVYGASTQRPQELPDISGDKEPDTVIPSIKSTSTTRNQKKKIEEAVKQEHSAPYDLNIPVDRINSIHKRHNPINISTGIELIRMPDEPKR